LLDLYRSDRELSLRKVDLFVSHLPMESVTVTAMRKQLTDSGVALPKADPDEGSWSQNEMLLAAVIDEIRQLQYITLSAAAGKQVGNPPEPIPRPGTTKKRKRKITAEQAARLDPRLRGGGGG
jgi:hypothetical protein